MSDEHPSPVDDQAELNQAELDVMLDQAFGVGPSSSSRRSWSQSSSQSYGSNDVEDQGSTVASHGDGSLSLSPDVSKKLRSAIHENMAPVSSMTLGQRALALGCVGLLCAGMAVVSYGSAGISSARDHLAQVILCGLVATLAAMFMTGAFVPHWRRALATRRYLLPLTVIGAWSLYVIAMTADVALLTATAAPSFMCGARSLIAGGMGAAAFMWIWRSTDPWSPRISGAMLGACAGSISCAAVGIPCAASVGGHLLVGHWLAVPILALVCAGFSHRVLSP